jgi:DnaK suppressor protein
MSTRKKTPRPTASGNGPGARKAHLSPVPKKRKTRPPVLASRPIETADSSFLSTLGEGIAPYPLREGEAYMNPTHKEHFQRILTTWKQDLMEEVDLTVHHMQDEAMNFPDPNDRATQESEFSLELRTRDRERKLIRKIDEALLKLETDEYGYCDRCGIEIGIRRLEARPIAAQCIDCKTIEEIREKQLNG